MNVFASGRNAAAPGLAALPMLSVHDDPRPVESLWRDFEADAVGHVFACYDWATAWLDAVGAAEGLAPRVVVAEQPDGRPAAIMPLVIRDTGRMRRLEWAGDQLADYHGGLFDSGFLADLAADSERFAGFFAGLLDALDDIDLVGFKRQPATLGGLANPFRALPSFPTASYAHAAHLGPDWSAYYEMKRRKGWRRTDRRKAERMAEHGEISFVTAKDDATATAILDVLFEQKREGLARIGVADMFAPPGVRDFYRALARRPWPDGPAHLCALYCGDRIVATNFGLIRGDTYYYVLHAYDPGAFAEYSPGRQLMYELMQWCIARGIPRLDFTIGDESYKDNWCNETLELFDSVLPVTLRGRAAAASRRLTEQAKRTIKTTPSLWAAAQTLRRGVKAIKS